MKKKEKSVLSRITALLLAAVMLTNVCPVMASEAWAAEAVTESATEEDVTEALTEEQSTEAASEAEATKPVTEEPVTEPITEDLVTEETVTEPVTEEDLTESVAESETDSERTVVESCENGYLFKLTEDAPLPEADGDFSHIGELIYSVGTLELLYEHYSEEELVYVEENIELEFFADPNDTYYTKQQTYLSNVNAQAFWDSSYGLDYSDVTIAIIDSGLAESHEDFIGNHVVAGKNYVTTETDTGDTSGHGTQVAGIISAIQNNGKGIAGLTSGAGIVPLRVSNAAGTLVMSGVATAIYDAVAIYEADVINLSLGTSTQSDTLDAAVAYAISEGAIVVAAVGNDGTDKLMYPAATEGVIGVSAVDGENIVRSNSQRNDSVFVAAPGENIYTLTTNNRYTFNSGTSFSAPFVTAMAAAARAYDAGITHEAFQQLLIDTSIDKGDEGYDTSYGYGVIDIEKYLLQLTGYESGTPLSFQYAQDYGSTRDDAFLAVERTKDGGYVAVGYTFAASTNPEWGYTSATNTNNDAIVVIFDADMNVIWSANFGTDGVDILNDVTVLNDGTIVAVGRTSYAFTEGATANASGYIVTIDPQTYAYTEAFVGANTGGDYLEGVIATSDGGYAVAGRVSSYDSADFTKIHSSSTTADGVVLKYSADGTRQFSTCYNSVSSKTSRFYDVAEDNEGNLVLVGDHQIAKNLYNAQIVKFSGSDGTILWSKSAGTSKTAAEDSAVNGHTSLYSAIAVLNDGTYVTAGLTKTSGSDTGENWGITGDIDGIIVRYQPDGTVISSKNIGELSADVEFENVVATADGGYIVIGATAYDVSGLWTITGSSDPVMIKYDANHRRVWSESYGSTNALAVFNDLVEVDGGEFMGVGESNWNRDTHSINATVWNTKYFEKEGEDNPGNGDDDVVYVDGVYSGTAQGFSGAVTVEVTITNGVIADISVTNHTDTASYMESALAVIASILSKQSAEVDSVSGATVSSNAIKSAVAQALNKAAETDVSETPEPDVEETYSINYVLNGGTNNAANKTKYTTADSFTLALPTRSGYTFDGWYTEASFKTKVTKVVAGTSGNLTFYAKWSAAKYKVTFNANGGTSLSMSATNVTYAGKYGTMPTVKRNGYTFNGWYTAKTGGSKITASTVVSITGDQTLYAQWSVAKYKVTFNANGGTKLSVSATNVTYTGKYGTMPTVQRKGYTFKGWYMAKTGGSKITESTVVSITGDQTLYARWTKVTKPGKAKIKSLKSAKAKQLTLTIKKVSGADGYQIVYSTNKKFKSAKKKNLTTLSKKIKGLKRGKTYYVKVRAYKLDSAGNKVYGSYGAKKKITIK